jgi:hypothetical protein
MKCKKEKDWVSSWSHLLNENEFIRKVRKRRHWNPLFGHIGDEISKNREKKEVYWASRRMKLSLVANLMLN